MIINSTNINKTNNHLSSVLTEHKKDQDIWRWTSRSWIGRVTEVEYTLLKEKLTTKVQFFTNEILMLYYFPKYIYFTLKSYGELYGKNCGGSKHS